MTGTWLIYKKCATKTLIATNTTTKLIDTPESSATGKLALFTSIIV